MTPPPRASGTTHFPRSPKAQKFAMLSASNQFKATVKAILPSAPDQSVEYPRTSASSLSAASKLKRNQVVPRRVENGTPAVAHGGDYNEIPLIQPQLDRTVAVPGGQPDRRRRQPAVKVTGEQNAVA